MDRARRPYRRKVHTRMGQCGLDSSDAYHGQVAGFCEHGNELS